MRISDWSSDVCSSDLPERNRALLEEAGFEVISPFFRSLWFTGWWGRDRKSVVKGKSVSVRVDLGGRRIIKKKRNMQNTKRHIDWTPRRTYINRITLRTMIRIEFYTKLIETEKK